MIGYRFLQPADEEMTEASLFYEAASTGLGKDFLDQALHKKSRTGLGVVAALPPHSAERLCLSVAFLGIRGYASANWRRSLTLRETFVGKA